ncbi:MAG: nicotinate-nucleotide--dimethylbenzimidazole phosphoribosyltransferase [Candidatus Eiseniibacteriota bacterium]
MTDQPRPAASLDEMRALLAALPTLAEGPARPGDPAVAVLARLAAEHGRDRPRLDHPRVALFAAAHGVAARLPQAGGPDLGARIEAILERRDPLLAAAEAVDADLRLYELAWPRPSADITRAPALSDGAAATAMAYGMMAVDEAIDILGVAALGDEGAVAAGAIGLMLFGGAAEDWGSRDTAPLIAEAVARHRGAERDAVEMLRRLGGEDIAAIAGAVLAARFARVAVVLDGAPALAAAAILERAAPGATVHCLTTSRGRLGDALGLPAVMDAAAGDAGLSAVAALRGALDRVVV